jgi:hypothetical protein
VAINLGRLIFQGTAYWDQLLAPLREEFFRTRFQRPSLAEVDWALGTAMEAPVASSNGALLSAEVARLYAASWNRLDGPLALEQEQQRLQMEIARHPSGTTDQVQAKILLQVFESTYIDPFRQAFSGYQNEMASPPPAALLEMVNEPEPVAEGPVREAWRERRQRTREQLAIYHATTRLQQYKTQIGLSDEVERFYQTITLLAQPGLLLGLDVDRNGAIGANDDLRLIEEAIPFFE